LFDSALALGWVAGLLGGVAPSLLPGVVLEGGILPQVNAQIMPEPPQTQNFQEPSHQS